MRVIKDITDISQHLPIIAYPSYLQTLSSNFGYFISDEDVIIPFIIKSKFRLRWLILTSPPLNSNDSNNELKLVNEIVQYSKNQKYIYITCTNQALFSFYPLHSKHCVFGTYKVNLQISIEELFSNLHPRYRNKIRKAEKDGIIIEHGNEFRDICINIIVETHVRQGLSMNTSYFDNLDSLNDNIEYFIAKDIENNIHGSAIFFWNENHTCYYMYGGSSLKHHAGALNLLHWRAMVEMKAMNVKCFDFVGARINPPKGSKYEGIQLFKSRFGSNLHKGYLFKVILSSKYYFFNIMIKVYSLIKNKKRYIGDMIDQESKRGNIDL